ncbi:acyltransferase family protein [Bacillus velezensis]|uniref:acyltransferase family protein n=1 Tax=Bacillus TaxID=1386 RepID=UPI00046FB65A|nr:MULTISPECIES: acyltransferase family protein [Bacillus]SLC50745.1 Intercellular adhesion protein C [Mycobacteroides abscessus subsp. massiliense]ATY27508.1 acyltransferase [Bacillus velezensis]KAF6534993.1 acyltransferase family protein [Bacillus sp. EKM208B]MBL3628531.1 acyltransferase family protein [Bacillus sp. RHF6]MBL4956976.1 acyltransferase family protein [Bacillus velezensis]
MQIKEIFVIRCLSCLSVVLLHVVSMVLMIQEESLASAAHTVDAFRTLLMFSTPAFIFISEFLLARSYPGGVPAGFLKKRGKVIFVPFLFIAAVDAILMKSVAEEGAGFVSVIGKFLENVFLGNFIGYFILVIFQFYILHMLLHRWLNNTSPVWVLSVSFIINAVYLAYFSIFHPPASSGLDSIFPFFWVPFPGWVFYFCLAFYCGKEYPRFLALINQYRYAVYFSAAVSAILIVAVSYISGGSISSKRPDIMIYAVSMIFLCFHLFSKLKKVPAIVMMISNYSFSIYLLHSYFLISGYLLEGYLRSMPLAAAILLLFLICTLGPIFVSWVCNHFRYGYLFVGKVYQPKQTKRNTAAHQGRTV